MVLTSSSPITLRNREWSFGGSMMTGFFFYFRRSCKISPMHPLRTRFKKEIVAEFLPPTKRADWRKNRVVILCDGMPTVPHKRMLLDFFSKKGYWVFHPRYRGTWESRGRFLKNSPERDILDVIAELPKGFKNLWDRKRYKVRPKSIYLIASSFGGPAAILASRDSRVTKVVANSPIVDWRAPSKTEPIDFVAKFTRNAFGEAYRFSLEDWKKLKSGRFYNPATHARRIDGRKIFILHAKDDDSVLFGPVKRFSKEVGAEFLPLERGGHGILYRITKPRIWRKIRKFLSEK